MIEIYCQSQSHARRGKTHLRRCKVRAFYRDAAGLWQELVPATRNGRVVQDPDQNELDHLFRTAVPKPAAGHWVVPNAESAKDYESAGRRRFSFVCKLCQLTVEARGENFYPVLDGLDAVGVGQLSLEGLRARIEKAAREASR